ncbi:Ion channel [Pseudoruegeria aquimaris]|uniref:Ion channel n=1 Tax=Pseudoruegeria aquimaris TaxID=393663 RepID=A0A1Y5S946_9RHOB|nr:potassium channel family protein [Pseudoruegeria aquimaris]SLN34987.1 Ion channel [Pseudoruegeria aquimaris]
MADEDNSFGVLHAEPVIYCGRCRETFGEVRSRGLLGDFVRCPNQKPEEKTHVCRVIKPNSGEFWAILESWFYRYESEYSPLRRNWFGFRFNGRVGLYNMLRTLAILLCAALVHYAYASSFPNWVRVVPALVAFAILIDILVSNSSVVFISRFSASAFRSTFEMIFGYLQFILCFGVFYFCYKDGFVVNLEFGKEFSLSYFEAVYFSIVTATTLGYGDISPRNGHWLVQSMVMGQLMLSLYYGAIILGGVASWINEPKHLKPFRKLHPVEDILRRKDGEEG